MEVTSVRLSTHSSRLVPKLDDKNLGKTGVRIDDLRVTGDDVMRDDDVGSSKLCRVAVGYKFSMANVGIRFVENRKNDGDLGVRGIKSCYSAEHDVGVSEHVG